VAGGRHGSDGECSGVAVAVCCCLIDVQSKDMAGKDTTRKEDMAGKDTAKRYCEKGREKISKKIWPEKIWREVD